MSSSPRCSATCRPTGPTTSRRSSSRCCSRWAAPCLNIPGIRLRGNVWLGEGVELDDLEQIEAPAFVGNYARIGPGATVGPYSVLAAGVTLREQARTSRSVVDSSTYIGRSAMIEGAILGRSCDVGSHVLVQEGAAIGDEVALGTQSVVTPGVRIYPNKEVETGAQVTESLIWESRAASRLWGREGVSGLVNVDITPEVAVRLAAALGTALKRGDARVRETYADDLLATLDRKVIRERGFRIVVDYGYSAASYVLPLVLGPLGVEAISAHAFAADSAAAGSSTLPESIGQAKRLVPAVAADLGAVFDRASERLFLIDEQGREIAVEQTLLLFLRLIGSNGRRGKLAFPVTVTSEVDRMTKGTGLEVVRTPASLAELTQYAAQGGVVFAGALGGGYVFPEFLPAYDAVASLCKLLELLAPTKQPVSELVGELPVSTLVHRQLPCPWALKGLVMRVLSERLRDRKLDLTDGIKVFEKRGWAQVLPDPDEPFVHIYAEGKTDIESRRRSRCR